MAVTIALGAAAKLPVQRIPVFEGLEKTPVDFYNDAVQCMERKDYITALDHLTMAADKEYIPALKLLAKAYDEGLGTGRNPDKAHNYYVRAFNADNSDLDSYLKMAMIKCMDFRYEHTADGEAMLQELMDMEYAPAFTAYGIFQNKYRSPEKAAPAFKRAAELGDIEGMCRLGQLYNTGKHVEKDQAKALELFRKCTDAGNTEAMWELGRMYEHGTGVSQDIPRALELYRKSASAGNLGGLCELARTYHSGIGVPKDYLKAAQLWYKAAKKGNAHSQYCLAHCFWHGQGVQVNYQAAFEWMEKAAMQDHESAKIDASRLRSILDIWLYGLP